MQKRNRERVLAEITISYLMRLGIEQGCPMSREQALEFLNEGGRAYEMWKHMMQAAEDFIARSLRSNTLRQSADPIVFRLTHTGPDGSSGGNSFYNNASLSGNVIHGETRRTDLKTACAGM